MKIARKQIPLPMMCVALILIHAILAWSAVSTKSSTFDEPLHAFAGYSYLKTGDFRINPEHPPLWKMWAGLGNLAHPIPLDLRSPFFEAALGSPMPQWNWTVEALYRTPGMDGEAFVRRSRAMMLLIDLALGAMIMYWGFRLAGPVAALVAGTFWTFDPNFLAHGPLVTNDVSLSLELLLLAFFLCRKQTIGSTIALGIVCGAALCTKYSAVVFAPIVVLVLLINLIRKPQKPLHVLCELIGIFLISCIVIWAVYGFRFATGVNGELLDTQHVIDNILLRRHDIGASSNDLLIPIGRFLINHHLLPQTWVHGLLASDLTTIYNPCYLLGKVSYHGWWYYFPVAIAVKSSIALILACILAAVFIRGLAWAILIPPVIFFLFAMWSHFNIGLRHVLPVYPFAFLLLGTAAAQRKIILFAIPLLVVECLLAWPNYIAFFNAPARAYGDVKILADSNLDWGQDLPLLAEWQKQHPYERLYLSYFGTADPAVYNITYTNIFGGYDPGPPMQWPTSPGTLAISATNLIGIYADKDLREFCHNLRQHKPKAILGRSIYLYDWPLSP